MWHSRLTTGARRLAAVVLAVAACWGARLGGRGHRGAEEGGGGALGGLPVAVGVAGAFHEHAVEGGDGAGAHLGGLDAGAGGGGTLDEGEPTLDMREFHPLGDGEDGGVELGGDLGEGGVGAKDGAEEVGLAG